jgi:hypothetical protein
VNTNAAGSGRHELTLVIENGTHDSLSDKGGKKEAPKQTGINPTSSYAQSSAIGMSMKDSD